MQNEVQCQENFTYYCRPNFSDIANISCLTGGNYFVANDLVAFNMAVTWNWNETVNFLKMGNGLNAASDLYVSNAVASNLPTTALT